MAAAGPTVAQAALISSLSQDEIPIKLRCAICSKLAVNAFRLPCCEQAICETCQSTLPSSCPVCEHTPVSATDCKPNKSLRTTIKVFLRTEEKKREALRLKEAKTTPPVAPPTLVDAPALPAEVEKLQPLNGEWAPSPTTPGAVPEPKTEALVDAETSTVTEESEQAIDDQQDVPQPSIEEIAPGQEQTEDTSANDESGEFTGGLVLGSGVKDLNGQAIASGVLQTPGFGMGFGFDNMGMMGQGTDFNQMQMMMAMQNGMASNAFGNFPMMGVPGMTMDPMVMQNMFMNGGFGAQSMGMNGMNMGMGMAGFDGGVGTGFNNGWNGQQSWNIGQDNFNLPNAAGMGLGDFGTNNSGYHAGYNQGNYGRGNQYNDYQQNGYGQNQYSRGRGRGRGYGFQNRGGHGYGQNDVYSQQNTQQYQNGPVQSESGSIPTGPKVAAASTAPLSSNVDEYGRELRAKSEAKISDETPKQATIDEDGTAAQNGENDAVSNKPTSQEEIQKNAEVEQVEAPKPIHTLEQDERAQYNGYSDKYGSMQPPNIPAAPKVAAIPFNAPTGPKAMREGLPNTSILHIRARGISIPQQNGNQPREPTTELIAPPRSRSGTPEKEKDVERTRSRTRSRSASQERRQKRRHRHRSTSLSDYGREEERRRERRRRQSRKYDDEDEADDNGADPIEEDATDKANGTEPERSRSQSAAESRRSSHRSRKDRELDREKERDREKDKDYKSSSHKHRSSHRSHRDRSRERDRGDQGRDRGDRDRDRDRDRARSRSRSRSREHRHRRRHDDDSAESSRRKEKVKDIDTTPPSATSEKLSVVIPSGPRSMTVSNAFSATSVSGNGKPSGIEINIRGASHRKSVHTTEPEQARAMSSRAEERKDRDRERDRERQQRDAESERERTSRHREERDRDRHSSRRESKSDIKATTSRNVKIPTGPSASAAKPATDPHTLEREKRNRDRLLKEAQRMAGLNALMSGTAGRKRSLDDGEDGAKRRSRKSRAKGERWEDGRETEGDEARIARLESEREKGRWD